MKRQITTGQMMKVIENNIQLRKCELTPEHKLILAIIQQAAHDLLAKSESLRLDAYSYFDGRVFVWHCELIGLDAESTRKMLVRGGFLIA